MNTLASQLEEVAVDLVKKQLRSVIGRMRCRKHGGRVSLNLSTVRKLEDLKSVEFGGICCTNFRKDIESALQDGLTPI